MGLKGMFSKLLKGMTPAFDTEDYTYEQLKDMEKQGYDVKELLEKYEKGENKHQLLNRLRFEDVAMDISKIPNATDVSRLIPFMNKRLDPNSDLIKKSISVPLMGKDKWIKNLEEGEVILSTVVQCAPQLWEVNEDIGYAMLVCALVENNEFKNNPSFLKTISKLLNDFRDAEELPTGLSEKMIQLHKDLDDPDSTFDIKIDQTLLDAFNVEFENKKVTSSDIRVATIGFSDSQNEKLPRKAIPSDGLLPFIAFKDRNEFHVNNYNVVNGSLYTA
ncbi:hypothetical protein FF125_06485 [Aureibaculum algae]|uniref:Uncharacterized protein n=1 Tax=Aureibaculum algae TaxID=2584122 RepID=A0A5B7TRP7_9FLAO|nr:hypothetical protein [Aureibaculum algae]QCX38091.1 hypothetical protein FF125_06485 [Aureibaculum algae]